MSDLMKALFVKHDGKIGVLSANDKEVVSQVIGTDLTLVYEKKEGNTYLLIPLTRNHCFKYEEDCIIVDGKKYKSNYYFQKDACQWIRIDEAILSKIA